MAPGDPHGARPPGPATTARMIHADDDHFISDEFVRVERRMLVVKLRLLGDRRGLALDERRDRLGEAGVADPVRAVGERRHEAALQLVLALRAGLEQRAAARDRALDQPVVAVLEVQHLVVGRGSPSSGRRGGGPVSKFIVPATGLLPR